MRVRLVRKLADRIDGIDLSRRCVGEVLDLRAADARLLIAEGWAVGVEARDRKVSLTILQDADAEG